MACGVHAGSTVLPLFFVVAWSFCDCISLIRLKAGVQLRQNSTLNQNHGKNNHLFHGRLLIGHKSWPEFKFQQTSATRSLLDVDPDYQADMGWEAPRQPKGQAEVLSQMDNSAVELLLKMEPKVECTSDSMKLQVQDSASTPGSLFYVDRGSRLSPLPLSKLPQSCGYTLRSTQRDMVLVAPYDGCFVTLEDDSYVLPLRWCGLPVRMLCPSMKRSTSNPPMVTCHANGMVVKTEWTVPVSKMKIKLNGIWEPLKNAARKCGISVVVHPEGVVVSLHHAPCVEEKDGMYTLELAGDGETTISCPSLSSARPEPAKSPTQNHQQETLNHAPTQPSVPEAVVFPQNPEVTEEKPGPGLKGNNPQFPYFILPHNFIYPPSANPDESTAQPIPAPPTKKQPPLDPPIKIPNGQEPYIPLPFYPWPQQPDNHAKESPAVPATTQTQNGREKEVLPYPLPKPAIEPDAKPSAAPQPEAPQGQMYQLLYPYPYPYHVPETSIELETKPTAAPQLLQTVQPEAPHDQMQKPVYPYPIYPLPRPGNEPVAKPPAAPEPSAPQHQIHQPVYPYPYHYPYPYKLPEPGIQPHAKPAGTPQPEAPHDQMQKLVYPYAIYPLPKPAIEPDAKPSADPQLAQTVQPEAPRDQMQKPVYPYPIYPLPRPGNEPVAEPSAAPEPGTPQHQIHQPVYPYPYHYPYPYKLPEPGIQPDAKPSAAPQPESQVQQPVYPYPYQWPDTEIEPDAKPSADPQSTQTVQPEAPRDQMQKPVYPYPIYLLPEPGTEPHAKPSAAPQPGASQGQMHQPVYPYPYHFPYPYRLPEPAIEPDAKTVTPPQLTKTVQPEAPHDQMQKPVYPYPIYPLPRPGNEPVAKPSAAPEPETPQSQMQQLVFPYQWPQTVITPGTKPTTAPQISQPPRSEQQHQQPIPLTPPSPTKESKEDIPAIDENPPKSSDAGIVQRFVPPMHCPQFCPSGFSNCCPQIAFHQHLHHIVPAGPGKEHSAFYSGLPFIPSLPFSFGTLPEKQAKETVSTEVASSFPVFPQSLPSEYKEPHVQPPDGNSAALPVSDPKKMPSKQPVYPNFSYNVPYLNWASQQQKEKLDNVPQTQTPQHYSVFSKPQNVVKKEPAEPPKQQNGRESSGNMNYPPGLSYLSHMSQYLQRRAEQKPTTEKVPSFHKEPANSKAPNDYDDSFVHYYMLQDAQAPTNKSLVPANISHSLPFLSSSKVLSKREPTRNSDSGQKGYVLLQHGPPVRELNGFGESQQPSGGSIDGTKRQAFDGPPENANPQQRERYHPEWRGKAMMKPLSGNVNTMQRSDSQSENLPLRFSASRGAHFVPFPKNAFPTATHLRGNVLNSFKGLRKPTTITDSSHRIPDHVPEKASQL